MSSAAPVLALDTASPVVSLALGDAEGVLAQRTIDLRQSSERLLRQIDDILNQTGWDLGNLRGLVVLQGPGSFTGLRVGLGTALGLHQALGLPTTAVPTLDVLARAGRASLGDGDTVIAAVDALRGEWMARTYVLEAGAPRPLDAPRLRADAELTGASVPVVGFGVDRLDVAAIQPEALAPLALELFPPSSDVVFDPGPLVQPIYFRPPAVTPPKRGPRSALAKP